MAYIYLPGDLPNKSCKVVYNGYIRVYESNLRDYTDVFINQDYQLKSGHQTLSYNDGCDSLNTYVTDPYFRVDLHYILIDFLIIALIGIYLPYKIFMKMFRGRSI